MSKDYKALAEQLREQRLGVSRGGKQVAVQKSAGAPEKREISDKAANLVATALKDLLR